MLGLLIPLEAWIGSLSGKGPYSEVPPYMPGRRDWRMRRRGRRSRGRTKAKSHEHPERLEQEPDREQDRPGSVVAAPPEECRRLSGYSGGQIPTRASPAQ